MEKKRRAKFQKEKARILKKEKKTRAAWALEAKLKAEEEAELKEIEDRGKTKSELRADREVEALLKAEVEAEEEKKGGWDKRGVASESLNMSKLGLQRVTGRVWELTTLRHLVVSRNNIHHLSESIAR